MPPTILRSRRRCRRVLPTRRDPPPPFPSPSPAPPPRPALRGRCGRAQAFPAGASGVPDGLRNRAARRRPGGGLEHQVAGTGRKTVSRSRNIDNAISGVNAVRVGSARQDGGPAAGGPVLRFSTGSAVRSRAGAAIDRGGARLAVGSDRVPGSPTSTGGPWGPAPPVPPRRSAERPVFAARCGVPSTPAGSAERCGPGPGDARRASGARSRVLHGPAPGRGGLPVLLRCGVSYMRRGPCPQGRALPFEPESPPMRFPPIAPTSRTALLAGVLAASGVLLAGCGDLSFDGDEAFG